MDIVSIEGQSVRRDGARMNRPEARLASLPPFKTVKGWDGEWDDSGSILVSQDFVKHETVGRIYFAITVDKIWVRTWNVKLHAVAPTAPDPSVLDAALQLTNVAPEELAERNRAAAKVEALVLYGATAVLSDFRSERPRSAVLAAMAESICATTGLSLYLDCPANQRGATGWDFLRGLTVPPEKRDTRVPL